MGNFCKFCGKPIEGSECNCEEAVKERQASVGTENSSSASNVGLGDNIAKTVRNVDVSSIIALITNFVKDPLATFKAELKEKNKINQFFVGGVSLAVIFLISILVFNIPYLDAGFKVKFAFYIVLAFAAIKLLYAFGVQFFAKRANINVSYTDVLGLFSMTLLFDAAMLVIYVLLTRLSLNSLAMICFMFMSAADFILSMIVTYAVNNENFEKTYKASFVIILALDVIFVILMNYILKNALSAMLQSSLMNSLNSLDNLKNFKDLF